MLNKKHIFTHLVIGIILILIVVLLILYPLEIEGRTLVIIQHDNSAQRQHQHFRLIDDNLAIRNATRHKEETSIAVQRAQQEVANAYIPRSDFQASSRWYDIQRAEEGLDRAQRDYREADSTLYLFKRIEESDIREQRLIDEKRASAHVKSKIKEPPYQQYDLDED